jgi:hypothetical protein
MAEVRHLGQASHNALCFAWKRLVGHLGHGGGEVLAAHLGRAKSHISEYGMPHTGRAPSVATVLEAESFAGEPFVTRALAAVAGYRLVPIDEAAEAVQLEPLAAKVLVEIGQAFTTLGAAMADKRLTPEERARLEREFGDVELAAGRVVAALRGAA